MQWYYSKNGTQLGPIGEGELRAKLSTGEISSADLVWKEGMTDWLPSSKVPVFAVTSPTPEPIPSVADGLSSSPYTPPLHAPAMAGGANISNYLWQSIVVTLFCCLPFGIVAIVFAAKVDGLKQVGDIQGALATSSKAKNWCLAGLGTGLVVIVLYVALMVFAGMAGGYQ